MRIIYTAIALLLLCSISAQSPVQISKVYSSERQNKMASRIPSILVEAFRNGDIQAYYPKNPNIPVSYGQFLNHFGEQEKAQTILTSNPYWFCDKNTYPSVDQRTMQCLSQQFEVIEKLVKNRITMTNELNIEFIRLVYDGDCLAGGLESYGPMFRISDINKLLQKRYRIRNPRNDAVSYAVSDILKLRLFAVRE